MNFTPLGHVVCVIRERLGDILLAEGYPESSKLYADQLTYAFWRRDTLDCILQDLQFIPDADDDAKNPGLLQASVSSLVRDDTFLTQARIRISSRDSVRYLRRSWSWTARQSEHLASRQSGLQQLGQWGLSSNPSTAWSRFGERKAERAEVDRKPERFGEVNTPIQFCSARSQVREVL